MVSSMLLARALVLAFDAKPIIVCPADCVQAVKNCAAVVGLHIYEDIAAVRELPMSMGVVSFTKDASHAAAAADALLAQGMPAAVVSIEAPGEPLPYAAGDRIRFVPIDEDEFARIRKGEEAKRHDA